MIYTKTGDAGTTSLVGGTRVAKCDIRVEAYGTVDELNAHIALLAEMIRHDDAVEYAHLKEAQQHLFTIQTLLATECAVEFDLPQLPAEAVTALEGYIDNLQAQLPVLHSFVLPGGTLAAAQGHVARTVCRRAERQMVELGTEAAVEPQLLAYVNRLSDYLFVLSRHIVLLQGGKEDLVTLG